ncbi:MAG: PEP-CTERM sorting domain-containing protein [Planctomycetota bacterium]|jgi:hypothetical protein
MGKLGYLNKGYIGVLAGIIVVMMFCSNVWATQASFFSGWTDFTTGNEDQDGADGGQRYDAEHFFYKFDGTNLSIGMQTGFDMSDGMDTYTYSDGVERDYYAGDVALSFDGNVTYNEAAEYSSTYGPKILAANSGYEYALDFGLVTKDKNLDNVGHGLGDQDSEGLYEVSRWSIDIDKTSHNGDNTKPFAMDRAEKYGAGDPNAGDPIMYALSANAWGSETIDGRLSYYRWATFDATGFLQADGSLWIDAHWAMSCGNDVMNGNGHTAPVIPEPSTIALLGVGLAGLAGGAARRRMKKKKEEK